MQDSAAREGHRAAAPESARASGAGADLRALGKARGLTLAGSSRRPYTEEPPMAELSATARVAIRGGETASGLWGYSVEAEIHAGLRPAVVWPDRPLTDPLTERLTA